jgi:type II secretory pathway pseudopilin PulG
MTSSLIPKEQRKLLKGSGFTLLEILVAFSILMIVLMSVLQSRLDSVRLSEKTGKLNQVQDGIRADLAQIREQALSWKCTQGECLGGVSNLYEASRYSTTHCSKANPLEDFPVKSGALDSAQDTIQIMRNVSINGKKLDIDYTSTVDNKTVSSSASIIPQAMNWCS